MRTVPVAAARDRARTAAHPYGDLSRALLVNERNSMTRRWSARQLGQRLTHRAGVQRRRFEARAAASGSLASRFDPSRRGVVRDHLKAAVDKPGSG